MTTARLISKGGAGSASTRAICSELGITAPTLYYYFADKSILMEAVTDYSFDCHISKIGLDAKKMEPIEALKVAWESYMSFVIEEPELYSVMITSVLKGQIAPSGIKCLNDLVALFASSELKERLNFSARKSAMIYHCAAQGCAITSIAQKTMGQHRDIRDAILGTLIRKFLT